MRLSSGTAPAEPLRLKPGHGDERCSHGRFAGAAKIFLQMPDFRNFIPV